MNRPFTIRAAGASDRGRLRRIDEDAYLVDPKTGFFAVADGVGGNRAGEVASRTAIEAAEKCWREKASRDGEPGARAVIATMFSSANEAIRKLAANRPEFSGMATTLVILLGKADSMWVGHCGDSRAYRFRSGKLEALTRDHSMAAVLTEKSDIVISPSRSPFAHVLTKCLGKETACEPEINPVEARPGDRFLLCCDGLTDMFPEREIATVLALGLSPKETSQRLIDAANDAGGKDNITVVVADILVGD